MSTPFTKRIDKVKNPLFRLFLIGLRGTFEISRIRPYNFYLHIANAGLAIFLSQYIIKLSKNELEQRPQPNLFVPEYIYKVRKEHFIYWQLSRLARGLSTTFTFYEWDDNNKMMYLVDRKGKQTPLQSHYRIEDPQVMQSPIMEKHYPASPRLHSEITLYIKNINNPYDLDNHLHHKSVSIGDWIRTAYYFVYRQLGLTNRWRYDEYVAKPDSFYDWQQAKLAYRISKDRQRTLYKYLQERNWNTYEFVRTFLIWLA